VVATSDARPLARLLLCLQELDDLVTTSAKLEYEVVQLLHDAGFTWDDIGEAAGGISRQAARKKWAKPRRRHR
jgi:hypothetical protein